MGKRIAFFIATVAILFSACPAAARPPSPTGFRIGFLTETPLAAGTRNQKAFREGLREFGYVEGKNIDIEWRSFEGNEDRGTALAVELVRLKPDVIVAVGSKDIRAARAATATIPIVMVVGGDAVGSGFVASLARPGGNVTGLSTLRPELGAKRLELLKETVPGVSRVAVFSTSIMSDYAQIQRALDKRAAGIGVTLQYLDIVRPGDIEAAFQAAITGRADAVLFQVAKPLFASRLPQIADLAAKNRLPVIYERETSVKAGGLMSYGVDRVDLYRRAAGYVDKILRGAKPAELPVEQPEKFRLVINLKTAKALGIPIPRAILLRADRVID